MIEHQCEACDRPAPYATICGHCVKTLRKALAKVGTLYVDLGTVRRKATRFGTSAGKSGIGKAVPLVVDDRFTDRAGDGSQLDFDVKSTVVAWARMVMEDWPEVHTIGPVCGGPCNHHTCLIGPRRAWPSNTVVSVCAYLSRMAPTIAAEVWVAEMLDEVTDLEQRLSKFVDRPADRWYAGICNAAVPLEDGSEVVCTRELWSAGGYEVRCPDCGTTHPLEQRRKQLVDEARDREVTVRMLARIIVTLGASDAGEARIESRINTWVQRKRITSNGKRVIDGKVRPVYRVGDVLDLLEQDAPRRSA